MAVADALTSLLAPTVDGLGYELLGIEQKGTGDGLLVRLYIDHDDGIGVEDCETVSRQVSDVMEAEQAIRGNYTLEVSSPGLDRPLFTPAHYQAHLGEIINARLRSLLDGRRKISGSLLAASAETATFLVDGERVEVPYSQIERARLVPLWSD